MTTQSPATTILPLQLAMARLWQHSPLQPPSFPCNWLWLDYEYHDMFPATTILPLQLAMAKLWQHSPLQPPSFPCNWLWLDYEYHNTFPAATCLLLAVQVTHCNTTEIIGPTPQGMEGYPQRVRKGRGQTRGCYSCHTCTQTSSNHNKAKHVCM